MNPSTFRSNLKTQLDARSDFSNESATVHRYDPGKTATKWPWLALLDVTNVTQEDQGLAGDQHQTFQFDGVIEARSAGSSGDKWATAEDQAWDLINGLIDQLTDDQTVNGVCERARVTSWVLSTMTDDKNLWCEIEFQIQVDDFDA